MKSENLRKDFSQSETTLKQTNNSTYFCVVYVSTTNSRCLSGNKKTLTYSFLCIYFYFFLIRIYFIPNNRFHL